MILRNTSSKDMCAVKVGWKHINERIAFNCR